MSLTTVVENNRIKLPIHVPDGTEVEIVLPQEGDENPIVYVRIKKFPAVSRDAPAERVPCTSKQS